MAEERKNKKVEITIDVVYTDATNETFSEIFKWKLLNENVSPEKKQQTIEQIQPYPMVPYLKIDFRNKDDYSTGSSERETLFINFNSIVKFKVNMVLTEE